MAARDCRPKEFFYKFLVIQDKATMPASSYMPKDDSGKAEFARSFIFFSPRAAG
jgi:hypothetical protein